MTVSEAVIAIMGPQARTVLQPVIDQSLDNQSFRLWTGETDNNRSYQCSSPPGVLCR